MQSTLRCRAPDVGYRNTISPARLSLIRRRFKEDKREAVAAPQKASAPADAVEDAPAKAKFNHAYLIFNPAAGQESPVGGGNIVHALHKCEWPQCSNVHPVHAGQQLPNPRSCIDAPC